MPLFFLYLPASAYETALHCKPTQTLAFIDIVQYMRRIGLRKSAPKSSFQIRDESLRTVRSSHGELTVDARGNVTHRRLDNHEPDGGLHLAAITRFDLGEWLRHWAEPLPASFRHPRPRLLVRRSGDGRMRLRTGGRALARRTRRRPA